MLKDTKSFSSFSVDNLEKAKGFYSAVLELEVSEDTKMGLLELHLSEGKRIMIYPKENHEPATYTILNFIVDDIDTAVEVLQKKGIQFEQYGGEIKTDEKGIARDAMGPQMAWFKDPAGNILALLEITHP